MSLPDRFRKWASGCPPKHYLLYGAAVMLFLSILFTYSFGTSKNWLSVFIQYFIKGYIPLIILWLFWYKLKALVKNKNK